MRTVWKFASAAVAGLAASALIGSAAEAGPARAGSNLRPAGVVFVQNDAIDGNRVLAYERIASGKLVAVGSYATGGRGGALSGSVVDHLASEGSLAYDAASRVLIAVNPGSDTITTFDVRGDRLHRSQVLGTGGQFPVSVAVRGSRVFVLNARDGGSISGYLRVAGTLVPVPSWHRELHLNTSSPGQSDEFTSTPAQIGFTPDGATLLVSTKNGGNSVLAFPLGAFGPAASPTVNSLPNAVPFGFSFDGRGRLVLTEAGPNAVATFAVGRHGKLSLLDTAATGQAATCWVTTVNATSYVSNAGSGTLSLYASGRKGALTARGTAATDAGTVDAAASRDGRFLYVQTGGLGTVDAYRISAGGSLTAIDSVTVPDGIGGEGIVAL